MKTSPDVPGTTRSCSFTSCFCDNLSCKHSLLRRILYLGPEESRDNGKDLTSRERRLLDKLIAEYDKVKSDILSSINRSAQQKIDAQPRTHKQSKCRDTEDAERAAMLELVKLVDKSQALGHHELSECCSCCTCNSSICSYYKKQRHRHSHARRTNYGSKSSLSRHKRTPNERALCLKEKHVYSDPCTCTTKLSSVVTIESKKNNTLQPNKLLSINNNDTNRPPKNPNRPIKKHLKQIKHSEISMNRRLSGSMKSLNRKIKGEVKKPFITVLIKETKSKLKDSFLKNDEIIKSCIQVGRRGGNLYEETLDNTNLLTSGGLVINTKIDSNQNTRKKVNFWKSTEKIVRLMQKSTKLIGIIEPASETKAELMQGPKTRVKTSIKAEKRGSTVKVSRTAKNRQEQAGQRSCQQKILVQHSQDSKIRNRKNIKTRCRKVHAKSRETKYWPSHPTCLSEECTSQDCYNLLSLRKARLAETPRINRLNIKKIIEKSLSDLGTQLEVIQPVIKRKFSKKIEAVTSIKDVSKIFLDIEGKQFVKSFAVGMCTQSREDLNEGTKNEVLPNCSTEPGTLKSAKNASTESLSKVKKKNKTLEKKYNNPAKQSKNQKLDFSRTIQQDPTVALSGNIDFKSTSKSLLLNTNYSHFSFKSLNSITFSGSNLINLMNQSSVTNSYVPQCFCTTNANVPVKDNYYNGHSNDSERCKLSISACKILTIERQSDSRFLYKTKGLVSSVSTKSPLNNKAVESQVHANAMLYSTLEISPFANVQTVYQCQPVKCPNMKQIAVKAKRSKICLVAHKCESHMSVPIECDPNKCLKVVTTQTLKCKSHSSQSLREAISTLNIMCPCICQKCQVAPPPDIQCQRKKSNQSKCPDSCSAPSSEIHCQRKKSDKKLKKSQLKCPDKHCRAPTSSTSSDRRDKSRANISSVSESQMMVPIKCDPNKCLKAVTKKALQSKSYSGQSLREAISTLNIACPCKCQKCQVVPPSEIICQRKKKKEKLKQSQSKCLDKCMAVPPETQCQGKKLNKKLRKSQSKCPDKRRRASTSSIATSEVQKDQSGADISPLLSSQGIRLKCRPRPSPCPVQCDSNTPGLLTTTTLFIRRCFCKKKTKGNIDIQQCAQMLKNEKKHLKETNAKVTSETFECGDRNYMSSLNQLCDSTTKHKSSKKSKATNCVYDSEYPKELSCKPAPRKQAIKVCSNYSFRVEFCKGPLAVNKVFCVGRAPNNHASSECKWELITPRTTSVFSTTCKPSENPCYERESTSKEYLQSKCCKKKKRDKNSSSEICKNKKPKPDQCPSVKYKSKPQKPQKSITILTVCKGKKTCPLVKSKIKISSKKLTICTQKQLGSCQSMELNCKPALNYKCKPQQSQTGIQVCNKVKSKSAEVKCQLKESNKSVTVCKNSKQSKDSSVECNFKPTESHQSVCHQSVTVGTEKATAKCCTSTECECKQIGSHKSISVCNNCKIKCVPLKCERKSTETDKSVTVCNVNEYTKCLPSVKNNCKCKPLENTSICQHCKLQIKRTSLVCKCKTTDSNKYCPKVEYDCKPKKSVSVCKNCKRKKKIKCTPKICECKSIEPDKCGTICKKNKLPKCCPSEKSKSKCIKPHKITSGCKQCNCNNEMKCQLLVCECKPTKPHKSITVCKNCKGKKKIKCTPLICECKFIEPDKCGKVCKKNKLPKCYPSEKSESICIKPHKITSGCKKCNSNKKMKCQLLVCECKPTKPHKSITVCKNCKGKKKIKCTPLICECKFIEPDKCGKVCKKNKLPKCCPSEKSESICIKPHKIKSECKKCNSNKKNKCQLLICECKPTKPHKSITDCKKCKDKKQAKCRVPLKCECKKDNKQLMRCPSVDCECKPPVNYKCKSQISCKSTAQQQKCYQPVECECLSYMLNCSNDKDSKKSQRSPQDEDITKIRQFINAGISFISRYFKSETERDETEKRKSKKPKTKTHTAKERENVFSHCGHITKASQTSCKQTKSSSKKNQAKCNYNKVKSCSAPKQQVVCSGSESSIGRKQRKQKSRQGKCKSKLPDKNNKCVYDIETRNRSIKSFFKIFFSKNKKCTTTAENKDVQCPRAKMSAKGNKLATQPCQTCSGKVKQSQKKLKKCGSRGDTVSKNNATISTSCSESTDCSKKRANKIKSTYYECQQCIQHTKSKSSGKKACKQQRCYSNIGDTGPILKHCYCSPKLCKNASKNNYTNCHQVYHVETQPTWDACRIPLGENVPYKFDPGFFVSSQHNRDVSLQNIICCDKNSMLKSPSQMVDVKTETMSSSVKRALMRRLCYLEIQNADKQIPSPNITVGKVPTEVDKKNYQKKRHLSAMPLHELELLAPNEISTIFPYTPKNKLSKEEASQNLNHNQQIYQSPEKSISCKSRLHENYDGLKQKSKHTEKKIKVPKHISPRVIYIDDQVKVNVQKQSISSGITRIVNICVSLFTRQKNTAPKSGMSKCHDNRKNKLYQTASLKIPYGKRHSLVENVICTSSKSDSQPKKQVMDRTKKPTSLANPKFRNLKDGSKHYQDLIPKQQIKTYSQYETGDACEQVLNVPPICINNKYPDIESQKEILSYFCKPQFDTEKGLNPYGRDYTVGYAFRAKKQKRNCHRHCTSGVQSSSRGLFKHAKSETKDKNCNPRCTGLKVKGILKKNTINLKHLKPKSMSCCDVCCDHKNHIKAPKIGREEERSSVYHRENEQSSSESSKKRKFNKKHKISRVFHDQNERSTSKSGKLRKFNKKHNKSRAVGPKPCDSSCLVNLTREGRLEKPKPKIQKPLRFRKTCRDDCKHMKHMERVKIKKEEKIKKERIKKARSQTKKLTPWSQSSFLRSITNSLVGSFVGKSKTSVLRQNYDTPPTPLFEIHIDSKDYRVLNREQTIYSISEWQRKEMERRTAELRHGKDCRCCICVRSALQQSSRTRKKNDKSNMVLKDPSTVECVCGSSVCDKERKKMIDQLEQEISRQQAQQKPCVCGSKICAKEAEIALKGKVSKSKGKGKGKGKEKRKRKKKKKEKEKKKKEKKGKKEQYKKKKEKREEKERRKMEKEKEKRQMKKKKPDIEKRKREMEKAQEKLQRQEERKKEKLEREKEKKKKKIPKKPKKTARELLDEKMKQFGDARKKKYANWQKSREFKRDNKYEVAARERHKYYVAKMNRLESNATQERSEPDMQLIAKSIADLFDVSATCVQSAARQTYRRIMQPEPKDKHIKRQNFKTNQYVVRTTFRNIQRRLLLTKVFGFIGKLGGGSNRYRRKRKSPENWGCNMYMQTLRVKRFVWLYKTCPWFYPYCLNIITVWRHFAFFVLFFVGAIFWTPCFLCMELCNLLLCCHC